MSPEKGLTAARAANDVLQNTEHGNIRTATAIEKIFENLDRIPIEELEKFANQFNIY